MTLPPREPDLFILKHLQDQARELGRLTRDHPELATVSSTLLEASQRIGEELAAYQRIQQEWEWFFENSLDMFAVATLDGRFRRVNSAFERVLGYSREELLASPFTHFVHPEDIERTHEELVHLGNGRDTVRFENRYRHRDGRWRWLEWTCPAATPQDRQLYAIARDVSDSKLSPEERLYRAEHDSLTGLGNRALFDQALSKAVARTQRNPDNQVALLLIDLDGFKQINDAHGFGIGDAVLKSTAGRLATCHREGDVSCRIGGDDFALVVEGSNQLEIDRLAGRLLELLHKPIVVGNLQLHARSSLGVACFPHHAVDAASLLRHAEAALAKHKRDKTASSD